MKWSGHVLRKVYYELNILYNLTKLKVKRAKGGYVIVFHYNFDI